MVFKIMCLSDMFHIYIYIYIYIHAYGIIVVHVDYWETC